LSWPFDRLAKSQEDFHPTTNAILQCPIPQMSPATQQPLLQCMTAPRRRKTPGKCVRCKIIVVTWLGTQTAFHGAIGATLVGGCAVGFGGDGDGTRRNDDEGTQQIHSEV